MKEFIASNDPEKGWDPIGPYDMLNKNKQGFYGNFDGNGNVITSLWINRENHSGWNDFGIGLFATIREGSKISNLGVIIDADKGIQGQSGLVGGLVGSNYGSIENSYTNGSVSGTKFGVGGLVGSNYRGSIENSYSNGSVTGTSNSVGGLVGSNSGNGSIENSYSNGSVTGTSNFVGGLAGTKGGTIRESYYNKDAITDSGFPHDDYGKSESDMKSKWTYVGWNFTDIWCINGESEYPYPVLRSFLFADGTGTRGNPWIITTAEELDGIRNYLSGHYKLGNDIDLTAFIEEKYPIYGWEPIIRTDSQGVQLGFQGSFNGAGHLITGLWIDRDSQAMIGLFAETGMGSKISNLGVVLCDEKGMKGKYCVGGLVGYNFGDIENCYNNGSIIGAGDRVGGLVGVNTGSIENSYSSGSVTGTGDRVGGLVGVMREV